MKRLFRRLKLSKGDKDVKPSHTKDSDSESDDYRAWWETDSFVEELKAKKIDSKGIAECRQQLLAEVQDNTRLVKRNVLLQDAGGTGGRNVSELALQNLALNKSTLALRLGQFKRAHSYLEALETPEHLPATYFFSSQIYNTQGYRNRATEQLQLALDISPPSRGTDEDKQRARFHDLLKARLACTTLDSWKSGELQEQGPEACLALATGIWEKWLRDISPSSYDPVAVLLFQLYTAVTGDGDESIQASTLPLIDSLISTLVSQSRIAEAFDLFTLRCERSDSTWDQQLSFLDHLKRPPADIAPVILGFTAELQLRKARWVHLNRRDQGKLRNKLVKSSEKNFKKCGHAWGHLDAQKFKLLFIDEEDISFRMQSIEMLVLKVIESFANFLDAYRAVDFPSRQIDTMEAVLDMCVKLSHVQGVYDAHKYIRDVCKVTGRTINYWVHHLVVMAADVGQSADIGSFLQDCLEFPPSILNAGDHSLTTLRLKIMFYVSYRTGNVEKVLEYGPRYIEALEQYGKERDASDVVEMMAAAQLVFDPESPPQEQRAKFESGRSHLATWIDQEKLWFRQDQAVRKMILLAKALIDFRTVLPETAVEEAGALLEESSQLAQQIVLDHHRRGTPEQEIMEYEATYLLEKADVEACIREVSSTWENAIRCGEMALNQYSTVGSAEVVAALKLHHGRRQIRHFIQAPLSGEEAETLGLLLGAKKSITEALEFYASTSQLAEIVECKYWEAMAMTKMSEPLAAAAILRSTVQVLNYLLDDAPASPAVAVGCLQYKQSIITGRDVRRIFTLALDIATSYNEPVAAWEWIQQSKARSLSDMLGLNRIIEHTPEKFLDDLDWACRDLPYIEMSLDSIAVVGGMTQVLKSLRTAPVEQREWLKREFRRLKEGMRKDPVLQGSLAVLTGAPATLDDLRWISMATLEQPIFLDWAAVGDSLYLVQVEMVDAVIWPRRRPGEPPRMLDPSVKMHKLDIGMAEVERWRNSGPEGHRYLDRIELSGEDAYDNLNMLKELVAPIPKLSKEGDILVLCPTGAMHGIPLHAIEVSTNADDDSIILLERNPVVYTYSHSVLRQCVARSKSKPRNTGSRPKAAFFGVYENRGPSDPEPDEIKRSLEKLATKFDSSVSFGAQVTENEFMSRTADAVTLIHFHGHTQDKVTALEQSLVLAEGHSFNARSVFDLDLNSSPLVTLIACASVDQTTIPGDEPLGILSAFLYSGAGSAVGTLWPTLSEDGRRFSQSFYDNFPGCTTRNPSNVEVVNVAKALQQAALSIKRNGKTDAPYHWAQFVLYGSWFHKYSSGA